ncbi:unnamed protein product [Ectocarpus fasciculatus]
MATAPYPATDEYKPINRAAASPTAYAVTGQPVPQAVEAAPVVAAPGAPTTGMWVEERYCGLTTWLITVVGSFPCSYFCPCDRRTVWVAGGKKYDEKGAIVDDRLFVNPFEGR